MNFLTDILTDILTPFLTAVDQTSWPTQRLINPKLRENLAAKYGYQHADSWSWSDLKDLIRERIKTKLNQGSGTVEPFEILKTIARHLHYRAVLEGERNQIYINAADCLRDMARGECHVEDPSWLDWPGIMDSLRDLYLADTSGFYNVHAAQNVFPFGRESAVANAMKYLRQFGCQPLITDGDVVMDESDFKRVQALIEKEIEAFGGVPLLKILFNHWFQHHFNADQDRFNFVVHTDNAGRKLDPSMPIGYLVNLCLKHPHEGRPMEQTNQRLQAIQKHARHLVAALDVEPYSSWETEFKAGLSVLGLLRELALLDSNFKLPQVSPKYFLTMIEGLFSWIQSEGLDAGLPLTYADIRAFAGHLHGLIQWQRLPTEYREDQIFPSSFSAEQRSLLSQYLVHEQPPNQDFHSPVDWHRADAIFKPFVRLADGSLLSLTGGWTALATLEAVLAYFRGYLKNFDARLGYAIEHLVKTEFARRGLKVSSGEYKTFDRKEAEVDVAVELADLIPLLEIKKKPLTRKARAGADEALLMDLSQSLLDSQVQALRHELTLMKTGQISFKNGSALSWNQREIERISVCLFDYGGLQDRTIIRQLLPLFYRNQFSHPDPRINDGLKKLNAKTTELGELYDEWVKVLGGPPNIPFFSCWFLSVPQILLLLDGVTTAEDFRKNLWHTRHMTMKTLDFYYEHAYMRKIKGAKNSY